ncbi:MAG: protein-glutamate O-methyltransferase CheR [Deltaproteobacteria bacterium]|nr:protein-glutamate O-methyltransferase CheR [Deltaproteobacteria bacterium]
MVRASASPMNISDQDLEAICRLMYQHFGIHLNDQKRALVVSRLHMHLRSMGMTSFKEYIDYIVSTGATQGLGQLVDRLSTNHTFFFREKEHFDFLVKTALPEILSRLEKKGTRDLRIWSAGCSSGEEPYSLVVYLMEFLGLQYSSWDAGLLATDISGQALAPAKSAVYSDDRLTLVPEHFKQKYFQKLPDKNYMVKDFVKKEVTFRRLNLMTKPFPFKRAFHVIFCRNVMIYFDQQTREDLVRRFFENTEPGGYLFIGHSESLRRESCPYDYVLPAVYRKRDA